MEAFRPGLKNILNSTDFLGRISLQIRLKELPLSDVDAFWAARKTRVSDLEKLRILNHGRDTEIPGRNIILLLPSKTIVTLFLKRWVSFQEFYRIF